MIAAVTAKPSVQFEPTILTSTARENASHSEGSVAGFPAKSQFGR